jgi:hypothetical protein
MKPKPGDISIVDKTGTFLMWYDMQLICPLSYPGLKRRLQGSPLLPRRQARKYSMPPKRPWDLRTRGKHPFNFCYRRVPRTEG